MNGRPWTDADDRELERLVMDRVAHKRIAAITGRTHGAIRQRCAVLGIRKPLKIGEWAGELERGGRAREIAARTGLKTRTIHVYRYKLRQAGWVIPWDGRGRRSKVSRG